MSDLVADDLMLDRLAARVPAGDDPLAGLLAAVAAHADRPLTPRPVARRASRHRVFTALTALVVGASGAGVAAAVTLPGSAPAIAGHEAPLEEPAAGRSGPLGLRGATIAPGVRVGEGVRVSPGWAGGVPLGPAALPRVSVGTVGGTTSLDQDRTVSLFGPVGRLSDTDPKPTRSHAHGNGPHDSTTDAAHGSDDGASAGGSVVAGDSEDGGAEADADTDVKVKPTRSTKSAKTRSDTSVETGEDSARQTREPTVRVWTATDAESEAAEDSGTAKEPGAATESGAHKAPDDGGTDRTDDEADDEAGVGAGAGAGAGAGSTADAEEGSPTDAEEGSEPGAEVESEAEADAGTDAPAEPDAQADAESGTTTEDTESGAGQGAESSTTTEGTESGADQGAETGTGTGTETGGETGTESPAADRRASTVRTARALA